MAKKITAREYSQIQFYNRTRLSDSFDFLKDIEVGEHWKIDKAEWQAVSTQKGPFYLTDSYKRMHKGEDVGLKIRTLVDGSGWVVSRVK